VIAHNPILNELLAAALTLSHPNIPKQRFLRSATLTHTTTLILSDRTQPQF